MASINGQKGNPTDGGIDPEVKDEASFVYGFPNASIEYVMTQTPIPLGWMRSVNALQVAFAAESFMDEVAAAGGKNPLELRLHLLSEDQNLNGWQTARMRGVVQMATDKAGRSEERRVGKELRSGGG